jgi:hypothetical protein
MLVLRYPIWSVTLFAQIYVMKMRKVCRLECGKLLYPVEIRWFNSVDRNRLKTFDGFDGQQAVANWKDNLLLVSDTLWMATKKAQEGFSERLKENSMLGIVP